MPRHWIVLDQAILGRRWFRVPKADRIELILSEFPCCCEPEPAPVVLQFPRKEDQGSLPDPWALAP